MQGELYRYHGPVTAEVEDAVEDLFTYHAPDAEQKAAFQLVRDSLAQAFKTILTVVPPSPNRTRALNDLVDARMKANAAISFRGRY